MAKALVISWSAGRTSTWMTKRLLDEGRGKRDIYVLFANTGEEDERTLLFADRADKAFGFNAVWLEAVVNPVRGQATGFRVVTFETATRPNAVDGPFEQVIRKYGLPNKGYPHCNRELKLRPIYAWLQSQGVEDYDMAIGIRADEVDRVQKDAEKSKIIYPLIGQGITKADVIAWWKTQVFDLTTPEHFGNCRWCWKKSDRKTWTVAQQDPSVFDFPRRMDVYEFSGGSTDGSARRMFRGRRTGDEVVRGALIDFNPADAFVDDNQAWDDELDRANGVDCSESCDVRFDLSEEAV